MSLVAIVQKQLVEVDKKLKEEDLLDGISLTSVLPGPVAVNTIAYVGYHLRGIPGAVVTFAGIIIPSFLLVIFLSWLYFSYGNIPAVKNVFSGITPAITLGRTISGCSRRYSDCIDLLRYQPNFVRRRICCYSGLA